jgi:N-acetylglucosaminyldiphosphoundecaprenol N-acetyl-beta-D-mannosaminyltransferase
MQKDKIKVLGVKFDNVTLKTALDEAISLAKGKGKSYIVTPNPEILLEAQKNEKFLRVLNEANLSIPDGIGILWASKFLTIKKRTSSKIYLFIKWIFSILSVVIYPKYIRSVLTERVTGTDLMQEICRESVKHGLKIFLLGARSGTAEKIKEILEKRYEGIKIVGTESKTPSIADEEYLKNIINKSGADILFVAYGAPNQELWIKRNLPKFNTVKLAIGVGGAFNFIANIKKRAPIFMQKLGLEWLFRLIQEPSRIKRIINATIVFAWKVL